MIEIGHEDIDKTEHLVKHAMKDLQLDECVWMRAVTPKHMCTPVSETGDIYMRFYGNATANEKLDITGCTLYLDESGGQYELYG